LGTEIGNFPLQNFCIRELAEYIPVLTEYIIMWFQLLCFQKIQVILQAFCTLETHL